MDFENQFSNLKNLGKQLEELVKLQNQAHSNLDKETHEKVKQYQIDSNIMLREFKKGNYNSIDDLIKKYTTGDARNSRK